MPRDIQLIGPAYADESLTFSAQDTVNWIPVPDESGMARSPLQLRGLPGLALLNGDFTGLRIAGVPQSEEVGDAYSFTFSVAGGTGPYTWSLYSGALPLGVTLNPSTGVISGTLTKAGSYAFGIQVTDSLGASAQSGYTVTVYAAGSGSGVPPAPPPSPPPTTSFPLVNPQFNTTLGGWTSVGDSITNSGPSGGFSLTGNGGVSDSFAGRFLTLFGVNNGTYIYRNDANPNVVAGTTVTASLKFRCRSIDYTDGNYWCAVRLETYLDAASTQLARTSVSPFVYVNGPVDPWVTATASIVCSNYVRFSVLIYGSADNLNGGASIYFDEATWDAQEIV